MSEQIRVLEGISPNRTECKVYETKAYIPPEAEPDELTKYVNRTLPEDEELDGVFWYSVNRVKQYTSKFYAKAYGAGQEFVQEIVIDVCDPNQMFNQSGTTVPIVFNLLIGETATYNLDLQEFRLNQPEGIDHWCEVSVSLTTNMNGDLYTGDNALLTSSSVKTG